MDTPTPATNVPQSFDLFAAAMKLANTDAAEKRTYSAVSESGANTTAVRSDNSAPAAPPAIATVDEPEHARPTVSPSSSRISVSGKDTASPSAKSALAEAISAGVDSDKASSGTYSPPVSAGTQGTQDAAQIPEDAIVSMAPAKFANHSQPSLMTAQQSSINGTPYADAVEHREDAGWTTVMSRKSKQKPVDVQPQAHVVRTA